MQKPMEATDWNGLLEAIGYRGSESTVGLYWEARGNQLVAVDAAATRGNLEELPWLTAMAKMGPPPPGICIGGRGVEATHWLVVDRTKNEMAVIPAPYAKAIIRKEPVSSEETAMAAAWSEAEDHGATIMRNYHEDPRD